ncbi:hypothetical protein AB5I41_16085 [Sphingomonas sp. MMS24-JH45]
MWKGVAGAAALLGGLAGAAMVADAQAPANPLTLERVFASPDLAGPQPQALKLSPDGTLLTSVRPRAGREGALRPVGARHPHRHGADAGQFEAGRQRRRNSARRPRCSASATAR